MTGPTGHILAPAAARVGMLLVALCIVFAAWIRPLGATLDPNARDQVHDLSLALRIREGTALSDGNRHPLFPALLAPLARREPGFFEDAWKLSVVLSTLCLLAVGLATTRVFGGWIGLVTVIVLAFELRLQARRICPEPLVAALLALGAAALAKAPTCRHPLLGLLAAGALAGAAWLAKGSALLSLGAGALTVLGWGWRAAPQRLGVFLAGFVVVASPLLAWNVSQGRAPTYNVNSAHVMWEDAWDEGLDRRSTATAYSWFERHGVGEAVARVARGLVSQRGVEWIYLFFGAVALAAWSGRRAPPAFHGPDPRRVWRIHAGWTALLWLLAFAWYAPIVSSRRLLFPCFAVLLPPTLDALGRVVEGWTPRLASARDRLLARAERQVPLAAGLVGAAAVAMFLARPATTFRGVDPLAVTVARDLHNLLPPGSSVWMRPSRTLPPDWLMDDHVEVLGLPTGAIPEAEGTADAVLLNEGLLVRRPAALARLGRWDAEAGVVVDASLDPARVLGRWPATGRASFVLVALRPGGG